MKELFEQWLKQHARLQILCRTGLGVEGTLQSLDEEWIQVKQDSGVQTLVYREDITMIHKPTEIQMLTKQTNPLKIS